ncbi:MAG: dihydroorotase, partial [Thermomicrobiales bacterium]|nr:dihydroorotase [Thermomicrobiales bacterium]
NTHLISGGRIIDPANGFDAVGDLLIRNGKIAQVGGTIEADDAERFDATGLVVTPGLIDLHVHFRTPGFEEKETIATGTAAAAAGGFTAVCCMPNTRPALDSVETLRELNATIAQDGLVRVFPIAAISSGRMSEQAVDFDALAAEGAIGFSDDGDSTRDSKIMRAALEASIRLDRPVMVHCEDWTLLGGAMNEGEVSRRLGIGGIPAEAEEIILARDILLAALTGGWLHALHVSTARGIEMIRQAKAAGVNVTAEVMPHHLVMSDDWVAGDRTMHNTNEAPGAPGQPGDPNTKVNPPLRPVADTAGLLEALRAGHFDIIATDHAPHAFPEKGGSTFEKAAMGMSALELALPTMLALVRAGHLSLNEVIQRLTIEPAKLLRKPLGTLSVGADADVCIFDPEERWQVTPETLRTKSPNTPMLGMTLQGRVRRTLVNGEERHRA